MLNWHNYSNNSPFVCEGSTIEQLGWRKIPGSFLHGAKTVLFMTISETALNKYWRRKRERKEADIIATCLPKVLGRGGVGKLLKAMTVLKKSMWHQHCNFLAWLHINHNSKDLRASLGAVSAEHFRTRNWNLSPGQRMFCLCRRVTALLSFRVSFPETIHLDCTGCVPRKINTWALEHLKCKQNTYTHFKIFLNKSGVLFASHFRTTVLLTYINVTDRFINWLVPICLMNYDFFNWDSAQISIKERNAAHSHKPRESNPLPGFHHLMVGERFIWKSKKPSYCANSRALCTRSFSRRSFQKLPSCFCLLHTKNMQVWKFQQTDHHNCCLWATISLRFQHAAHSPFFPLFPWLYTSL